MQANTLTYATPGMLFPAISLLMLAYTNRYLGISGRVRDLAGRYQRSGGAATLAQVQMLGRRLALVRHMQAMGVISLMLCTGSIFMLFVDGQGAARVLFGAALLAMLASLGISLREIHLSVAALDLEIGNARRGRQRAEKRSGFEMMNEALKQRAESV